MKNIFESSAVLILSAMELIHPEAAFIEVIVRKELLQKSRALRNQLLIYEGINSL